MNSNHFNQDIQFTRKRQAIFNYDRYIFLLLLGTAITASAQYAGMSLENYPVKFLSVGAQAATLLLSLYIILRFNSMVIWRRAMPLFVAMSFFPLIRIMWDAITYPVFKHLTDTLAIDASYYESVLTGLALSLLARSGNEYKVLLRYCLIIGLPIGSICAAICLSLGGEGTGWGMICIDDFIFPVALLALFPKRKINATLGWLAIGAILFVSSQIWSRSYFLVGSYVAIAAICALFVANYKRFVIIIAILLATACYAGFFGIFTKQPDYQASSMAQKFEIDTLVVSINNSIKTGDLNELLYWQGNSRADVLNDAFYSFTLKDWLWGRGISAEYESFVKRSTIEVGWAQELFRWGFLYVSIFLITMLYASVKLAKALKIRQSAYKQGIVFILLTTLIVKFLDGFIFGLAIVSVYNVMVFWAVMHCAVRSKSLVEMSRQHHSYNDSITS